MDPGDALTTAARIAVALAGFAGVVVAFRRGSLHDWAVIDKFRLWLLLGNLLGSFRYVLFFGMIGALIVLLQIYNAARAGGFFLFYAAIIFPLAIGAMQFARMILLPTTTNKT